MIFNFKSIVVALEADDGSSVTETNLNDTMYIDINIGEGRSTRTVVKKSDDPAALALNFAQSHGKHLSN